MRHRSHHGNSMLIGRSTRSSGPLPQSCAVVLAIMLALKGIAFAVGGGVWWQSVHSFVQSAEHTEGTVIEIVKSRNKDGDYMFSPVVEYSDHQGQRHEYHSTTKTKPSFYSVGDKVQMLYDRERPDSANIDHWLSLYLGPLVLGFIAAVDFFIMAAFFIAVLLFFRSPKDPENNTEEEPAAF